MDYDFYDVLTQARDWAEKGVAEGRLSHEQLQSLLAIDQRAPEALFSKPSSAEPARPLIVAFMGGTGVGKSSLLNRLAGQPIARAGIERPTSREVTLYHHRSIAIQQLPASLPLDKIKISQHDDARNGNIVWIDMPDFDSIEQTNKRMVLEWLPHIDVLLYVVSPERYRDNKAWQLLLAEGARHAWLFVMNQWDRGLLVQYQDFMQQLLKAGFENPLVFRTSCTEPEGDEFAELLTQLQALSGQHSIRQLERRGHELRGRQLKLALQALMGDVGKRDYRELIDYHRGLWRNTESSLMQGLAWPMRQLAQFWSERPGQKTEIRVWDDWAQGRLNDMLDELVLQAAQLNIPTRPLKSGLNAIKTDAEKKVSQLAELAGRQALFNPGNALQRFLLRLTGIGETLLPIAAMAVVGYQVFSGYYRGATDTNAYLGVDFAVHSVLLIGLSWLIPFFLNKKIQPSLQTAALKGLQKGARQALLAIEADIESTLDAEQQRNAILRTELTALMAYCEPVSTPKPLDRDSVLGRALPVD